MEGRKAKDWGVQRERELRGNMGERRGGIWGRGKGSGGRVETKGCVFGITAETLLEAAYASLLQ